MTHAIFDTKTIHFLKDTELYGLGSNVNFTLGKTVTALNGNPLTNVDTVQHIAEGKHFEFITGGLNLTVALDANGRVWTCGSTSKTLGRPTASSADRRVLAPVISQPERMTKVQVHYQGFMALGESGRLYGVGQNYRNVFGLGEYYLNEWFEQFTPIYQHKRFIDFSSSHHNMYGIDDYGDVYGWGCSDSSALGDNPGGYKKGSSQFGDTLLSDGVMKFKKVISGTHRVIALREDGQIGGVGTGVGGLLGETSSTSTYKKFKVNEKEKFKFKKIYMNESTFFGIKLDDTLWVGGGNSSSLEGLNKIGRKGALVQLGKKRWDQISPRAGGMYGLQKDGSLWTWGSSASSLNFIKDAESNTIYSPTKVENITGVTKLKDNVEEAEFDEFEYLYDEQKIDMTFRNRGLGIIPVHTTSSQVLEVRYMFKEFTNTEVYKYMKFTGSAFQNVYISPEEAFEQAHTLEYIKTNESKILGVINKRGSKRLYLVAFTKMKGIANDYFFKESRQTINETSTNDGMSFNSRIFFPGHSKNIVNKELLEFES